MKKNCFAAILFVSLGVGYEVAAKDKGKPPAPKTLADADYTGSLAVTEYTGDEEKPVTLAGNFKLSRESVMKNVDDKTAVILVYNGTGRDVNFQLDFHTSRSDNGEEVHFVSSHGRGLLLKGEKRIIKAKGAAPFMYIRLHFGETARFHNEYFKGGVPYLFTLGKKENGDHGKATFKEW